MEKLDVEDATAVSVEVAEVVVAEDIEGDGKDVRKTGEDVADINLGDNNKEDRDEEQWTSRISFILAAIGSAIGLGNFWRFPYLCYSYGGAVFFIPYLIALFFVGIPLMQLEMSMGQVFRRAATQSFGELSTTFRGLGVAGGSIAYLIVLYYNALLGWSNVYFINSFKSDLPWDVTGLGRNSSDRAVDYFFNDVLQQSPDLEMNWPIFFGSWFMWLSVFAILYKGQWIISKVVWVTVLLPVFMLFILIIVGATLEGADIGIKAYLFEFDFSKLSNGSMWADAFGQIFFSLSLSTGVMSAYSSMNPRHQNILQDAWIVSICNCTFSLMAGFAVFSVAGYFAEQSDLKLEELRIGGPLLAFATYPAGLSLVGTGAGFLCVMFFVTFYMLGIDSSFSLIESAILNLRETKIIGQFSREHLVMAFCGFGALISIPWSTNKSLELLDVSDYYVGTCGLLLVGFLEALVATWIYKKEDVIAEVGANAVYAFDGSFFGGILLGSFIGFVSYGSSDGAAIAAGTTSPIGLAIGCMFISLAVFGLGCLGAIYFAKQEHPGMLPIDILRILALKQPEDLLINRLNVFLTEEGANENWKFSMFHCITLKFFTVGSILVLIMSKVNDIWENNGYDSYSTGYQVWGFFYLGIPVTLFLIGIFMPHLYEEPQEYK